MKTFGAGDRVKLRVRTRVPNVSPRKFTSEDVYGTVTSFSPNLGCVVVRLDSGEIMFRQARLVRHVSPLEELALVGKAISNPKFGKFDDGDRVTARTGRYVGQLGTISGEAFGYPSSWYKVNFKYGKWQMFREEDIEPLSDIELLADVGKSKAKKNPPHRAIVAGDLVRVGRAGGFLSGKVGRALADEDRQGWCQVEFDVPKGGWLDGRFPEGKRMWPMHSEDVEVLSDLELLSITHRAKKNPRVVAFCVGDRVKAKPGYTPFGVCGTILDTVGPSNYVAVEWDLGGARYQHPFELELVNPLEEMAALAKDNTSSFSAAWIEPSGHVHKLGGRQTHRKWANNHLGMSGESTEAAIELTKRGWVWLTTPTELNVWQLDTPPATAWKAAVTYSIENAPAAVHDETPVYIQPLGGGGLYNLTYKQFVRQYGRKAAAVSQARHAKKNPNRDSRDTLMVGDRVRVRVTLTLSAIGTVTQNRHGINVWVKLDVGDEILRGRSEVTRLTPIEELSLVGKSAKNNPKLSYPEAKRQVLASLAGLPQSHRIDGKCLLANTTLCGLAGGRLAIGIATHREAGPAVHVWVVDVQGQVQDALSAWYSEHREDPAQARHLGESWPAAQDTVQDVAGGLDVIAFWRLHRGV